MLSLVFLPVLIFVYMKFQRHQSMAADEGIKKRNRLNERVCTNENLHEQVGNDNPLFGIENEKLLPLEEIGIRLTSIFGDEFLTHVCEALTKSKRPMDRLTPDESAAIRLYTMQTPLYRSVNDALRNRNRDQTKCFFPYLKLFYTAVFKLPWCNPNQTLWRGVSQDLTQQLIPDTQITWWQISSCTKLAAVAGMFGGFLKERLTESLPRSILIIETIWTKNIINHSIFEEEQEWIILSGTSLIVGSVIQDGDSTIFHLYDCPTPEQLLLPSFRNIFSGCDQDCNRFISYKGLISSVLEKQKSFLFIVAWSEGRLETFLKGKRNVNERILLEKLSMNEANVCILANKFESEQIRCSELSLCSNALDSRCAPHLAAILRMNCLTFIHLGCNGLGDDGAECLHALQYCHQLQELDLCDNQISDRGLGYLIAIVSDTAIKKLNVGKNKITDDGCKLLLAALPDTIEDMNFFSNIITKENLEIIKTALKDLKNLRKFNVGGRNPIAQDLECRQILEDAAKIYDRVLAW